MAGLLFVLGYALGLISGLVIYDNWGRKPVKKTPDEWLRTYEFKGIVIMDPDGWDRGHYEESWAEPITREEFINRLAVSTCIIPDSNFFSMEKHSRKI